jgi:hypothetical protein
MGKSDFVNFREFYFIFSIISNYEDLKGKMSELVTDKI